MKHSTLRFKLASKLVVCELWLQTEPGGSQFPMFCLGKLEKCKYALLQNANIRSHQARNQGGTFRAFVPPKFSKYCMAILIFVETSEE